MSEKSFNKRLAMFLRGINLIHLSHLNNFVDRLNFRFFLYLKIIRNVTYSNLGTAWYIETGGRKPK